MIRWRFCRTVLTILGLISLISFIAPVSHAANCASPNAIEGTITYNDSEKVLQYCDGANWQGLGAFSVSTGVGGPCDPANSPSPGQTCNDGSIYAGLSPDGNVEMYTTAADEGSFAWNNGNNSGYTTTSQTSNTTGETNTTNLLAIDSDSGPGGTQPHLAAQACANSTANGHSDWYLPAWSELGVLYTNKTAIGEFDTSGSFPSGEYWSSTEGDVSYSKARRFSDGTLDTASKYIGLSVRCVRKGYVAVAGGACTNPTAPEGTITYNADSKVPQYCSGSWIALSEPQSGGGGGGDYTTGLIHHWTLDEDPSGGTVYDTAGAADGTVAGTLTSVTGKVGNALYFDGSASENIVMGAISDIQGVSQLTLAAWMKRDGISDYVSVSNTDEGPAAGTSLSFWDNGNLYFGLSDGGFDEGYYALNNTSWHHVVMVFDGTQGVQADRLKGYVDGSQVSHSGLGSIPATTYGSNTTFQIGRYSNNTPSQGNFDEVRIYQRALTAADVQALYDCENAGACSSGGSCSNPTANEGTILYNDDYNIHQYCDGTNWIAFELARP